MKYLERASILVLLAFTVTAGGGGGCVVEEPKTLASRYEQGFRPIINGTLDTSQEHMGVVALYNTQGAMCTGTLIAPKVVLTAAHCIHGMSISSLNIIFGTDIQTGTWIGVDTATVHPSYDPGGGYDAPVNDIALVRMEQNAPSGVATIPYLPQAYGLTSQDVGAPLTFVGFGTTGSGTQNTQKFYFDGSLGSVCEGPSTCYYSGAELAPRTIGYSNQAGGPCSGDSGGPALYEINGQEYVAGVTSYGDQNCEYFGVSTKVDKFQTFIEDFIGATGSEDCMNGADDDGDGLIDCADPECASAGYCSGPEACEDPGVIECGDVASGTTSGGALRYLSYSCSAEQQIGPEAAYQLIANVGSQVTVTLTPTGSADLDLFIVPAVSTTCDPSSCVGSSTNSGNAQEELTFTLPPGGTYIVVDSYTESGGAFNLELSCPSTENEICDNSQDDDGDGDVDCADSDCSSAVNCTALDEECGNGVDDDHDGLVDCDDPDCVSYAGCSTGQDEICDNGRDDDGDGFVDCGDSDCLTFSTCQSANEICNDGKDNDDDGLIDCVDPECRTHSACSNVPPEECNNRADDDGDTFIDCADPDCYEDPVCQGRPNEVCFGGQDEDQDGLIDCVDPHCFMYQACAEDGGGGGCGCRAGANTDPGGLLFALLGMLGFLLAYRRRR
jgi:MYXO-CTERM domain-containing protein